MLTLIINGGVCKQCSKQTS